MRKVNEQRMPSDDKSSHCLWQGELKRHNDKHRSMKTVHRKLMIEQTTLSPFKNGDDLRCSGMSGSLCSTSGNFT